jgi:hypothetical protein
MVSTYVTDVGLFLMVKLFWSVSYPDSIVNWGLCASGDVTNPTAKLTSLEYGFFLPLIGPDVVAGVIDERNFCSGLLRPP